MSKYEVWEENGSNEPIGYYEHPPGRLVRYPVISSSTSEPYAPSSTSETEWHKVAPRLCAYCHNFAFDDERGNCGACGAPRGER